MLFRKINVASTTLALIATCFLVCSMFYAYKTGCTADLKTGSLGDAELALHYGSISLGSFIVGILCGTFSVGLLRSRDQATRFGLATMFFFFGGFAFWFLTVHFEISGVQTCLSP